MNDIYVLIDNKLNQIICPLMRLPEIWANINGLHLLPKEKLDDLTWAGHPNLSWKQIDNVPEGLSVPNNWLEISQNNMKQLCPEIDISTIKILNRENISSNCS